MCAPYIQGNSFHSLLPSIITVRLHLGEECVEPVPTTLIPFQHRVRKPKKRVVTMRQDLPSDDGVWTVEFSPNGRLVLTASSDGTARLWDAVTARQLAVLVAADHQIYGAVFSRDGRQIAIAPQQEPVSVVACSVCGSTAELIRTARSVVTRRFTPGERATLLRAP